MKKAGEEAIGLGSIGFSGAPLYDLIQIDGADIGLKSVSPLFVIEPL